MASAKPQQQPALQALARDTHGKKVWKRKHGVSFAARSNAIGLLADELPRAAMALPLAFMERDGTYAPVAVLGLSPGQNLLVDAEGRWVGRYLPAILRAWPFVLARPSDDPKDQNQRVLCVQADNDVIIDKAAAGDETPVTPLFEADGKPHPDVQKMMDFLVRSERSRGKTDIAVKALADAGVIAPWKLQLRVGGKNRELQGLFHVDEKALNNLPDEDFLKLRKTGSIALAHLMLMAEQNLPPLADLARRLEQARARAASKAAAKH